MVPAARATSGAFAPGSHPPDVGTARIPTERRCEKLQRRRFRQTCGKAIAVVLSLPFLCFAQRAGLTLWFDKPAPVWTEALPIGNGHVGAMVFGGANRGANNGDERDAARNRDIGDGKRTRAQDERLQLNESRLWLGSRAGRLNPKGGEGFRKVR